MTDDVIIPRHLFDTLPAHVKDSVIEHLKNSLPEIEKARFPHESSNKFSVSADSVLEAYLSENPKKFDMLCKLVEKKVLLRFL